MVTIAVNSVAPTTVFLPTIHDARATLVTAQTTLETQRNGIGRTHRALFFVVVAGCLLWTICLLVLTVYPKGSINMIMNTGSYDAGLFWLLSEPALSLVLFGVFGLVMVAAGYAYLLIKIAQTKTMAPVRVVPTRVNSVVRIVSSFQSSVHASIAQAADDSDRSFLVKSMAKMTTNMLASKENVGRKKLHVIVQLVNLTIQIVLLYQILEAGYPLVLVVAFTVMLCLHSLACAAMILRRPQAHRVLHESVVETVFDFLAAVGFPMLVVSYCFSLFNFDRARYAINLEVFPPGLFERGARIMADPTLMDVIDKSLNSLRIRTVVDFFTRIGTNLALCYQCRQLLSLMQQERPALGRASKPRSLYPTHHSVWLVFLAIPALVCVFVYKSSSTATKACSVHPECVVFARRWTILSEGDATRCPCLTLIAVDESPKTFFEWLRPPNLTEKVGQLASTGDLQVVKLVNRQLQVFPEELRRCKNLKHLALYYTNTETLPVWTQEFTKLEYLLIEGKFMVSSLRSLPSDLFVDMHSLTFLHLAVHPDLDRMPSFRGLTSLQNLGLALMLVIDELPGFQDLVSLRNVDMVMLTSLASLPDLARLDKLEYFGVSARGALCCNGFLNNQCNLSDTFCLPHELTFGRPLITCLPANRTSQIATEASRQVFKRFADSACVMLQGHLEMVDDPLTPEFMAKCNGIMFRQCELPGNRTGMCYNTRMGPITCNGSILPIIMRRRQIQSGVGSPCDPQVEAWLGCKG